MKPTSILIAALVMAAAPAASSGQPDRAPADARAYFSSIDSYKNANLERAAKNYVACLNSENNGVILSGLAHVAMIALATQGEKVASVQAAVGSLAVTGRTPEIRFKAYLTSLVYDSPQMFREEASGHYDTPDELFAAIGGKVQQTLLGSNDRKYVRPE